MGVPEQRGEVAEGVYQNIRCRSVFKQKEVGKNWRRGGLHPL
jgi:hypothetical protein